MVTHKTPGVHGNLGVPAQLGSTQGRRSPTAKVEQVVLDLAEVIVPSRGRSLGNDQVRATHRANRSRFASGESRRDRERECTVPLPRLDNVAYGRAQQYPDPDTQGGPTTPWGAVESFLRLHQRDNQIVTQVEVHEAGSRGLTIRSNPQGRVGMHGEIPAFVALKDLPHGAATAEQQITR